MAQTKRKRSTKHRGNAAGMVESRGRTGRKLTESERKTAAKSDSRFGRGAGKDRFNSPPTWRSAANRSLIAVVIFVAVLVLLLGQEPAAAFGLGGFLLILWRGLRLYWLAPDEFGRYLALGVTIVVVIQAFVNISVVLDLGPTKGIPLPMISSGGSSLMATLTSMGLLLSVSEHAA